VVQLAFMAMIGQGVTAMTHVEFSKLVAGWFG
jgi:hypothetical protein